MRRIIVLAALSAAGVLAIASPAAAELSRDTAGCTATATFSADEGPGVVVSASASRAVVPRAETVAWRASTNRVTHNQRGSIDLRVGPVATNVGRWGPTPNRNNQTTAEGVADVPLLVRQFPSVKWKVTGHHRGIEGQCQGEVVIEVEGSAASTAAAGVAGLAATAVALSGVVQAARGPVARHPGRSIRRGRPGLGAFSGLFLGLFLALDLFLFKVVASDSALFVTLPVVGAALGAGLGLVAPLQASASATPRDDRRYY